MQPESPGQVLQRVLLPYGREWADRNGYSLISRLLADEQLHGLIERYTQEFLASVFSAGATPAAPTVQANGNGHQADAEFDAAGVNALDSRLQGIEAQHERLLGLLEIVRSKMAPVARALGCCPECLGGIDGCPHCHGNGTAGWSAPDLALLRGLIVQPLAARGIGLELRDAKPPESRPKRSRSRP